MSSDPAAESHHQDYRPEGSTYVPAADLSNLRIYDPPTILAAPAVEQERPTADERRAAAIEPEEPTPEYRDTALHSAPAETIAPDLPMPEDPETSAPATPTASAQSAALHHQARRARRRARLPAIGMAAVAAVIGGAVGAIVVAVADRDDTSGNAIAMTAVPAPEAAAMQGSIGAAVAKIQPSVVTIEVTGDQSSDTGSGVIVRSDGYILTNDHVVSAAGSSGSITVVLADARTAKARIVGRDPSDDLAVLRVDSAGPLTAAIFASSDTLTVGQAVVAVGAPLGLSDTVTSGIVSNAGRPVRSGDAEQAVFEAIQTDAAINPGNSGGPLVDLNGSVIGINAAIASDSGGGLQVPGHEASTIGIGFAIPSDEASRIAAELIAGKKATHAVLGMTVDNSAPALTDSLLVHSVVAGGPAAKAGLKVGDALSAVGTRRVSTPDALIAAVRSHAPGSKVTVTFARRGKGASVQVILGSSSE